MTNTSSILLVQKEISYKISTARKMLP